jgi:N-acetyl-alpha-D-muramate 1-phosphate uridylyltransferase
MADLASIPIAILAGGLATRLRPITETIPKSLVSVAGRPFIEHQLEQLAREGLRRVVLCVGHLGEMVQDVVGDGSRFGLQVAYSFDGPKLLGTGGALRQALPLLGDPFFVLYGDSYLPIPFGPVADDFLRSGKEGLMTVFRNEGSYDTSNVVFADGAIQVYDKKAKRPDMRHIDYGLELLRPSAFAPFADREAFDLADLLKDLLARGQLAGHEVRTRFYEIGSHAGLEELDGLLGGRCG